MLSWYVCDESVRERESMLVLASLTRVDGGRLVSHDLLLHIQVVHTGRHLQLARSDHLQQRGLACTVGTHEAVPGAKIDGYIDRGHQSVNQSINKKIHNQMDKGVG